MNLENIKLLKLEDCKMLLIERLGLPEGEEPSEEQLQAEFEAYKAELIAEFHRIEDLKSRFEAMSDKGLLQGATGISNPDAHFLKVVLPSGKEEAESMLAEMEVKYKAEMDKILSVSWLEVRKQEYAKIDVMLMEAIAEKEAGRPEKMEAYLALREQIRINNPKP